MSNDDSFGAVPDTRSAAQPARRSAAVRTATVHVRCQSTHAQRGLPHSAALTRACRMRSTERPALLRSVRYRGVPLRCFGSGSHSVFRSMGLYAHSALRTLWSCGESKWALEQNFRTASMGGGQLVVASMPRSAGHRGPPWLFWDVSSMMPLLGFPVSSLPSPSPPLLCPSIPWPVCEIFSSTNSLKEMLVGGYRCHRIEESISVGRDLQ
ncbi:PREDICTED: uncharacterized protein LOC104834851 [Haliaeetus leucocephalus]|uniref:uncharacterized protein LOC104834851 n=1 Tax=Haliaeetus leucocephalus TaxID=52644 RepID=UPI00053CE250|nr:PREDICTED: uncharacterized protein LOC104834851 [Haliaeetus leucocephalus]